MVVLDLNVMLHLCAESSSPVDIPINRSPCPRGIPLGVVGLEGGADTAVEWGLAVAAVDEVLQVVAVVLGEEETVGLEGFVQK